MTIHFADGTTQTSAPHVKETFDSPCDGSVIALPSGNLTVPNVTSEQSLSTTYADIDGSSISYTPPSGTKIVVYRFHFHIGRGSTSPIMHVKFFVDGNWADYSRFTEYSNGSSPCHFWWAVNIGGTTTNSTGRLASWTSAKTLKLQAREYNSDQQVVIHETQHWDGTGNDEFVQPCIGLTAIG
tara:strand:- start:109 stop:657 length:549 start_codon:yes stop_codon:yes gene_type:complete